MTRTKRNTRARTLRNLRNAALVKAGAVRDTVMERVGEARVGATGVMTPLARAFEKRLSQAAARLGIPTATEVRVLARQVAELEARVAKLRRVRA